MKKEFIVQLLTSKRQLIATNLRKILAPLKFLTRSKITLQIAPSLGTSMVPEFCASRPRSTAVSKISMAKPSFWFQLLPNPNF
jgi:hypothetical protein